MQPDPTHQGTARHRVPGRGTVVTEMRVVPVAGTDSMLLNLSGAHGPWFTRNIVILTDDSGRTGLGEVPGGGAIERALNDVRPRVVGQPVSLHATVVSEVMDAIGERDAAGRGLQTYDERVAVHAAAGIECALLDLMGQDLGVPLCALLGDGPARDSVEVLGYLFYVGEAARTPLPYRDESRSGVAWHRVRNEPALDGASLLRQAEAAHERYGFTSFKLKGGVRSPEEEAEDVRALATRFPGAQVTLDPNGCWSLKDAIETGKGLKDVVAYLEDPCGAEQGFSGREILAEFRRATGVRTATNMVASDRRQLAHALALRAVDIPLADPHFWTLAGSIDVARTCVRHGLTWGSHSNNHMDISLAMFVHVGAAAPGDVTALDTHWIWQEGQRLTHEPPEIRSGRVRVPRRPGLGVTLDIERLAAAHEAYRRLPDGSRNDAVAMQYRVPGWKFDPKRPCLGRGGG